MNQLPKQLNESKPGGRLCRLCSDCESRRHTAIPRDNSEAELDPSSPNGVTDVTQYIASAAGFHFAFIEQGGTSLYAQLAQRVTSAEVLRILLSIGGTEIAHFQTRHDKAGNAPPSPASRIRSRATRLIFLT